MRDLSPDQSCRSDVSAQEPVSSSRIAIPCARATAENFSDNRVGGFTTSRSTSPSPASTLARSMVSNSSTNDGVTASTPEKSRAICSATWVRPRASRIGQADSLVTRARFAKMSWIFSVVVMSLLKHMPAYPETASSYEKTFQLPRSFQAYLYRSGLSAVCQVVSCLLRLRIDRFRESLRPYH